MIMVNVLGAYLLLLAVVSHGQSKSQCSVGWYGPNCKYQCHCAGSAPCDKHDGSCSSGCHQDWFGPACQYECISGKYGENCSKSCSAHCAGRNNSCSQIDGSCSKGCDPGYTGDTCNKTCDLGSYGSRCSSRCSNHCGGPDNACHHVTGTCKDGCHQGHHGHKCLKKCSRNCVRTDKACERFSGKCLEGCRAGYFGDKCLNNCSRNCARPNNECNRETGACDAGCEPGYTGANCEQKCAKGYYGKGCTKICSDHCAGGRRLCHHITGTCDLGCDPGYQRDLCTQAQTPCTTNGWFGPNCQYQCHCAGSAPCDKHDGSCRSGCHQDWFGPSCQYARMGFTVNENFNSSWLTDNRDTTCNRETLGSVTVTLDTPIPLTWLRVAFSHAVYLNLTRISYRNKRTSYIECPESNTAKINKVTADIYCPTKYPVTSVTLSGRGVIFLCSLYISAGRNVALKQRAEQSTWFNDSSDYLWWAEYAVDGKIPTTNVKRSSQNTCTHTALHDRSPWWKVSFTQPVEITRFIIENRRDCCQERLKNFLLTVYPVNNSYIPIKHRGSNTVKNTHSVVPTPRISFPVTQVKITQGFNRERILTLCEVLAFGEIACPSNRYGLRCDQECNCVNQTSCFVHSGGCPSGCAPGYTGVDCSEECETGRYGTGCTHNCSVTCGGDDNTCNRIDGTCTQGCDPGYSGRYCEDTCNKTCGGRDSSCNQTDGTCTHGCDPGYTGRFCEDTCSPTCGGKDNSCDQSDGTCTQGCDPGYTGRLCEDTCSATCGGRDNSCNQTDGVCTQGCDPGYTGTLCEDTCSPTCGGKDNSCNQTDGACTQGCDPGYTGIYCQSMCPNGTYGVGCSQNCSITCGGPDSLCHHVDGSCSSGCDAGFKGHHCNRSDFLHQRHDKQLGEMKSSTLATLIFVAVIAAAAAVIKVLPVSSGHQ